MSQSAWSLVVLSVCLSGYDASSAPGAEGGTLSAIPNDPLFGEQREFGQMQVLEAWSITRGSPKVLIGVVERGFDATHEEFQGGRIKEHRLPGMEHPREWLHQAHGTQVVGQIGAEVNNGKGVAGLAPGCRIIVATTGTHESFETHTQESAQEWNRLIGKKNGEAIRYLVDAGCKVINCSFTVGLTPADAFEYAIAHDVVVVVGSGNFNRNSPQWPAGVLDVLCVGGVNSDGKRWVNPPIRHQGRDVIQGSDHGKGLNVVAQCLDLVVCTPHDPTQAGVLPDSQWVVTGFGKARKGYLWKIGKGGTSNAAPVASALAGLIRSLRPDLNCKEVIRIIEQGANDLGVPGWDEETGFGRINFARSLKIAQVWAKTGSTQQAD